MSLAVEASSTDIYEAVVARRVLSPAVVISKACYRASRIRFANRRVRLCRHDFVRATATYAGPFLREPGIPTIANLSPTRRSDPAGWVWLNQQPLVTRCLGTESRWPEFRTTRVASIGVGVDHRTAYGRRQSARRIRFGCPSPYEPNPAELAFLERVASEFAMAVEAYLARQEAVRERDRLRRCSTSRMRLRRSYRWKSCFRR